MRRRLFYLLGGSVLLACADGATAQTPVLPRLPLLSHEGIVSSTPQPPPSSPLGDAPGQQCVTCRPAQVDPAAPPAGLSSISGYVGRLLWIEDDTGGRVLARLVSVTDQEVMVTLGGVPRVFLAREVARVSVDGDSLTNGMVIGGLIGAPLGALSCQGSVTRNCDMAPRMLVSGAVYAAIGAWIDARQHGRTVIYRAPRR